MKSSHTPTSSCRKRPLHHPPAQRGRPCRATRPIAATNWPPSNSGRWSPSRRSSSSPSRGTPCPRTGERSLKPQGRTRPPHRPVREIARSPPAPPFWDGKEKRPTSRLVILSSSCVLRTAGVVRRHPAGAQAREFCPVAGADRIQLLDEACLVQDLLNPQKWFALCPEDDLTLAEILKGPFGGLDDDDLFQLAFPLPALRAALAGAGEKHRCKGRYRPRLLSKTCSRVFGQAPFEFLSPTRWSAACAWGGADPLALWRPPPASSSPPSIDRAAAFDAEAPLPPGLGKGDDNGSHVGRNFLFDCITDFDSATFAMRSQFSVELS